MVASSTLKDVLSDSLGPRCALPCRLHSLVVYPSLVLLQEEIYEIVRIMSEALWAGRHSTAGTRLRLLDT